MKKSAKVVAIKMRKQGYSYNMIAEHVSVSKSTLSLWLAKIPYTPNKEVVARIGKARAASSAAKHKIKIASYKKAINLATRDIGHCTNRDIFIFGLAIYAGEGEKNNNVGIINSNPQIIVMMKQWFEQFYDIPKSSFILTIHLYPDNNINESIKYWSKLTSIPLDQFGKTQIDRRLNKKINKRSCLPYGTAHLRVRAAGNKEHGVLLSRRIQAASDIILEQKNE